jgi:hypothetical protein
MRKNDSIGLLHNQGIIYYKSRIGQSDSTMAQIILTYATNKYPEMNSDSLASIINRGANAALYDSTNYVPGYMSTNGRTYASQLISTIDGIGDSPQIDGTIDDIKEIESDILATDNLPDSEKVALLSATSVARYSMYYWLENIDSSGNDPYPVAYNYYANTNSMEFMEFINFYEKKFPNQILQPSIQSNDFATNVMFKKGWLRRLLKVVVGDLIGGFAGAGIGSLLCPNPICIFAGAFVGAMSGSLAAADSEGMLDPD